MVFLMSQKQHNNLLFHKYQHQNIQRKQILNREIHLILMSDLLFLFIIHIN